MTIDLATFRIFYPEFDSVADAAVTVWLDESIDYLSTNWGDCLQKATFLYTAHTLTLSQARSASVGSSNGSLVFTGGVGAIASASAGGASVSYNNALSNSDNADEAWYAQTPYGLEFMRLRPVCLGTGQLVGTIQDTTLNNRRI